VTADCQKAIKESLLAVVGGDTVRIFLFELKCVMGVRNTGFRSGEIGREVTEFACEYSRLLFASATTCERTERRLFLQANSFP